MADCPAAEWGLPNWQDASTYGETDAWEYMRWRWEFFRRRQDLRDAFDERAEETYRFYFDWYSSPEHREKYGEVKTLKPNERGFTAQSYMDDDFGYTGIPNPRISDQPSRVTFSALDYPGDVSLYVGENCKDVNGDPAPITLEDNQMAIVFNLDKPIAIQIERAKESLHNRQKKRHGSKLQKRQRSDLWLTYLRVLDARECGATWFQISSILVNTAGTEQAARDAWEQASALRFNF
jgi:hypothetical protein